MMIIVLTQCLSTQGSNIAGNSEKVYANNIGWPEALPDFELTKLLKLKNRDCK